MTTKSLSEIFFKSLSRVGRSSPITVTGLLSSTALQSLAEPCLSLSTNNTLLPCSCKALAKWVAMVVLPLPPFWFNTAITFILISLNTYIIKYIYTYVSIYAKIIRCNRSNLTYPQFLHLLFIIYKPRIFTPITNPRILQVFSIHHKFLFPKNISSKPTSRLKK